MTFDDIKHIIAEQVEQKKEQYAKGGTVRQYQVTRDGIVVVQTIIAAPMMIKKVAGNIKGLASKGGNLLQSFKALLKEIPHIDVKDKLSKLSAELKGKFLEAFEGAENKLKQLLKENPKVYEAWERVAKSDIEGLSLQHKTFAGNNNARRYQELASGDANLSFDYKGKSFDDFRIEEGQKILVDRKCGYGYSIFKENEFGELDLKNPSVGVTLRTTATNQINAISDNTTLKLRWEISTKEGAQGIKDIFEADAFLKNKIEVIFVPLN